MSFTHIFLSSLRCHLFTATLRRMIVIRSALNVQTLTLTPKTSLSFEGFTTDAQRAKAQRILAADCDEMEVRSACCRVHTCMQNHQSSNALLQQ